MTSEPSRISAAVRPDRTQFVLLLGNPANTRLARLCAGSLRRFGGPYAQSPIRIHVPRGFAGREPLEREGYEVRTFDLDEEVRGFPLAAKVQVCAEAEERSATDADSLVWLNLDCLVVNPPAGFDLSRPAESERRGATGSSPVAAFRPVHIRNVGSLASEPPDPYWQRIFDETSSTGEAVSGAVESFVDQQVLRPYYNTHCFSVDPSKGLLREWQVRFRSLLADSGFMNGPCADEVHRIFLHQAVLSAIAARHLPSGGIRVLPPAYSYPLHLQADLPPGRRAARLADLVCVVSESPEEIEGLEVSAEIREWIRSMASAPG